MGTEKYEKLSAISPTKEESILTAFAKSDLSKEITWDILLAIASQKYGKMELQKLKKSNTSKHKSSKQSNIEQKDESDSKSESDTDSNKKYTKEGRREENEMLPLSTLTHRFPWNELYKLIAPKSLNELEQEMQSAVNQNYKIRAMGSRFSWTNITFTDGLLIDFYNSSLNEPKLSMNSECFNKYGKDLHSQSNLLHSECGATIKDIHNILWPKGRRRYLVNKQQKPYKMIPDIPGYEDLCIGGL